jgi:hypothetical protein
MKNLSFKMDLRLDDHGSDNFPRLVGEFRSWRGIDIKDAELMDGGLGRAVEIEVEGLLKMVAALNPKIIAGKLIGEAQDEVG